MPWHHFEAARSVSNVTRSYWYLDNLDEICQVHEAILQNGKNVWFQCSGKFSGQINMFSQHY